MPDAYTISEARFIQQSSTTSAAGDLVNYAPLVPAGKIWTILTANYFPSASETKNVFFAILSKAGTYFAVTTPVSIALSSGIIYPALTEGMELRLFPGERLTATRDSATAGSTMTIQLRYIETDLPLYDYVEPQEALRIQKFRRALVPPAVVGSSRGGFGGFGGTGHAGGSGGVPRPK